MSGYLHRNLRPGALIEAASPRGDFVLEEGANPVLLISAGIGLTPVVATLHQLAARHSERDVWWIHGARRPDEHALAGEAHALLVSLPNAHEHVFYSAIRAEEQEPGHATAGRLSAGALAGLAIPIW